MYIEAFSVEEIDEIFDSNYSEEPSNNLLVLSDDHLIGQIQAAREFLEEFPDKKYKILVPCKSMLSEEFPDREIMLSLACMIDVVCELEFDQNTGDFKGISEDYFDLGICTLYIDRIIPFASMLNNTRYIEQTLELDQNFIVYVDPYEPAESNNLGLYIKYHCEEYTTNLKRYFRLDSIFNKIFYINQQLIQL